MIQIPGSFKSFVARSCRRLNPAVTGKFLAVLVILGLATLVNGTLPAGINSARFDAASYPGLPSGIYMYRLNARVVGTGETHVKAEKMLLIR